MNVTIETLDHMCTQRESQNCGEIIEHLDGVLLIRKYMIRGDGQKIPSLFRSRPEAETAAIRLGYTVID